GGGLVLAIDHDLTLACVPALGCDLGDTVAGAGLVVVLEALVLDGRPARLAGAQRTGPIDRILPAKLVRAVVDADLVGGGASDRVRELALRDRRHELGERDLQLFLAGGLLVDEQDGLGGRHAPTGRRGATDERQGGRGRRGRRRGTVRVRGIVGESVAVVVEADRVGVEGEILLGAGARIGQTAVRRIVVDGLHVRGGHRRERVRGAQRPRLVAPTGPARGDAVVHVEQAKAVRGRLGLAAVR